MELNSLAKEEGIDLGIAGNLPACGQARLDLTVLVDAGQSFEHVGIDHLIDRSSRAGCRIQMRGLQCHAEHQRVLGRICVCGNHRNGKRQRDCQGFHD